MGKRKEIGSEKNLIKAGIIYISHGNDLSDIASKGVCRHRRSSFITGYTNIYRSISFGEALDIKNTNSFNLATGGMEVKQFAFSYGEALRFGHQSLINQTMVVRAAIPNLLLGEFYIQNYVDPGIFTRVMTIDYEMLGMFNETVSGTIRFIP